MPLETTAHHVEQSHLDVVGTLGIADDLTANPDKLREKGMWMGIGLNEKTYPDQMVLDYARWISEHTDNGLIVIADDIQLYNKIPASNKGWDKLEDVKRVRKKGEERKTKIKELLYQQGILNVELKQWGEVFADLENESGENEFYINYGSQIFDNMRAQNPDLEKALSKITEQQAPEMFERFCNDPKTRNSIPHTRFVTSLYAQEEIFFTLVLAALKKYPIKVGHEGERVYDKLTLDIATGKWKGLSRDINGQQTTFGAIYLS